MQRITLSLFLTLILVACGNPTTVAINNETRILAFGDSLTQGKGVTIENSYPSVLSNLLGVQVINSGVSGEVTEEGLARLPSVLAEIQPDVVILMHGGNDILRNLNAAATEKNLAAMIEMINESAATTVLVGVPEKNLFSKSAPFYQTLATAYGLILDDKTLGTLIRQPEMKSDLVHLNKAGYAALAKALAELFAL